MININKLLSLIGRELAITTVSALIIIAAIKFSRCNLMKKNYIVVTMN